MIDLSGELCRQIRQGLGDLKPEAGHLLHHSFDRDPSYCLADINLSCAGEFCRLWGRGCSLLLNLLGNFGKLFLNLLS